MFGSRHELNAVTPQLEDSQTDLDRQDLQQTVDTYAGAESSVDPLRELSK
jgi:hypothetical protein